MALYIIKISLIFSKCQIPHQIQNAREVAIEGVAAAIMYVPRKHLRYLKEEISETV